jgi:hypothetical protein
MRFEPLIVGTQNDAAMGGHTGNINPFFGMRGRRPVEYG